MTDKTSDSLPDLADLLPIDRPFTRAEAHGAGVTDIQLYRFCRRHELRRPIQGVYVAEGLPDTIDTRAQMLALVVPDGCFVVDRTAAWLHGATNALAPNDHRRVPKISMYRQADAGRLRHPLAESGERTVEAQDLMEIHGLLVTTPLRTAVDLGRLLSRDQGLAALDALLGLGVFGPSELVAQLPRFKGARGVVQLRELAPLADGRAQSPGESSLRLRWYDAGLPRPDLQIEVTADGRTYFLDLGLEEFKFAAEYDGGEFHSSDEQHANDVERRDWLRWNQAWHIEVFTRPNIYGQFQDAPDRLTRGFNEAAARFGTRGRWKRRLG